MIEVKEILDSINSVEVNTLSSIFKLCLSMLLGSLVGLERKRKGQSAGIRTFALICMGASLAMILSIYVPQVYLGLKNGDPGRIAAQVISGIGFLGAGAIIQMKGSVRGLTTAAGIWMVAIIGMAVGMGMYLISIIAAFMIYFILLQLERFEHRIKVGTDSRIIRMKVNDIIKDIDPYEEVFKSYNVIMTKVFVAYDYDASTTILNFVILAKEETDFITLFHNLSGVAPTTSIALANQLSNS